MPATKAAQDEWFANAVGRPMNPDQAFQLQCKDVADDYCMTLYGNWVNTLRPGNGKDVFANSNPAFFQKILNNPNDPNLIPLRGDIIVYGPSRAVPEGHVAVVESADIYGCTVIQQDGYLQYPARRARLSYVLPNGAVCLGWIRPRLEPPKSLATPNQIQEAYMAYLERPADQSGIDHYTRYTIDFVRADLQGSDEYRTLQARKAHAAMLAADAEKRRAAEQAEAQRIAEEQAAAERLKRQAEEQARAVEQAKQNAASVNKVPFPTMPKPSTGSPVNGQTPAQKTTLTWPKLDSPIVRFLFAFGKAFIQHNKKKKA
jgi:hypothetical protein